VTERVKLRTIIKINCENIKQVERKITHRKRKIGAVRHQKESYSTQASHPAVQQFSSTKSVPVLVSQVQPTVVAPTNSAPVVIQ
jgi:hypothetical protein